MTEQENEPYLAELEWIERHGVKFLQVVLWELGLDNELEETLIKVLTIVHERTKLYVLNSDSARSYVKYCNDINDGYDEQWEPFRYENAEASEIARRERIKARLKRKIEAMDDDDPLPW